MDKKTRIKFKFVSENNIEDQLLNEEGLFSISSESLAIGLGDKKLVLSSFDKLDNNFLTKEEADIFYSDKIEIENSLNEKANIHDIELLDINKADKTSIYNKEEINQLLEDNYLIKQKVYSKDEINAMVDKKANKLDVYSRSAIDTVLRNKIDVNLVYTKTDIDTMFNNIVIFNPSQYYDKNEIDLKFDEKLNIDAYNSEKTNFATIQNLNLKANSSTIGNLQNTGLTGSTVTELLTDAKRRIDAIPTTGSGNNSTIGNLQNTGLTGNTVADQLTDVRNRIDDNITDIQTNTQNMNTLDTSVVKIDGAQNINGGKTFTGGITSTTDIRIEKNNPTFILRDSVGNKEARFGTIDNGDNLAFTAPSGGAVQFNATLRYLYTAVPTVRNYNEIPSLGQIKDQFAGKTTANTFTQAQTFSAPVIINERLRYTTASMSFTPSTDTRGQIYLSDGTIGTSCVSDLNLANKSKILNCPNPTANSDVANKIYVDTKVSSLTGTYMDLTGDQEIAGVKDFTGTVLNQSSDRTYGSNRYYVDNDSNGLGQPVFNTFGTKTEKQATIGFADASEQGKFEIKIENLPSRPNPKISLGNNTEIDGTLTVTGNITAPNMPVILPAGTTPDTTNINAMKIAYVLKP